MSDTAPSTLEARREAIVTKHIDAENSGNLDLLIEAFHRPHYDVVPMGAVFDGEAAVRDLVGGLVAAFPDFHFRAEKLHHAESAVIVQGHMTGTHRTDWAGILASGRRMDVAVACVFDFDADRLVNETVYFDFATLQRQLAPG